MGSTIQIRRDTQSNWGAVNPILADGEFGYVENTGKIKVGNGTDNWTTLPYATFGLDIIIGLLSNLTTTDKSNIVAAINEVKGSSGQFGVTDTEIGSDREFNISTNKTFNFNLEESSKLKLNDASYDENSLKLAPGQVLITSTLSGDSSEVEASFIRTSNGNISIVMEKERFTFNQTESTQLLLSVETLTDVRNLSFPDKNGVIATIDDLNSLIKGEYANNTAALADGLVAGDLYNLPIMSDIAAVAIVKAIPVDAFDITANWTKTYDKDLNPYPVTDAATFTQWLKDGYDGEAGEYNDGTIVSVSNFSLTSGRLRANVTGNNTKLTLDGLDVTSINSIGLFNNLYRLILSTNEIVTFGFPTVLPNSLRILYLGWNNLVTFDPSLVPPLLNDIKLNNSSLSVSQVNSILEYFDGINKSSPFSLYINVQSPLATPTGAGLTAKANLVNRGCTIYTD